MKEKIKSFYEKNKKTVKLVLLSSLTIGLIAGGIYLYKHKDKYYEKYL